MQPCQDRPAAILSTGCVFFRRWFALSGESTKHTSDFWSSEACPWSEGHSEEVQRDGDGAEEISSKRWQGEKLAADQEFYSVSEK